MLCLLWLNRVGEFRKVLCMILVFELFRMCIFCWLLMNMLLVMVMFFEILKNSFVCVFLM